MAALLGEEDAELLARLGHRDVEAVVVQADGYGHVLAGDLLGNERERFGVRLVAAQVRHGHAEEFGQRVDEVSLLEDTHLDEQLAEPSAR